MLTNEFAHVWMPELHTGQRKVRVAIMFITLELPPEVEMKLRDTAARQDAGAVRRLLTEALEQVVDTTVEALLHNPTYGIRGDDDGITDIEFEALADELMTLAPSLPSLPDSAIRREAIYEDHP
jgi:hypothetical protein